MKKKLNAIAVERLSGKTNIRWRIMFLCFLAIVIAYLDRVNLSVSAPTLMKLYGWNTTQFGMVMSAFFAGYAILNAPAGWQADRVGGRKLIVVGMIWWSLATILTPFGSTLGLMIFIRFMMGVGEAVVFPSVTSMVSRWMLPTERGRAQGFNLSGMMVGAGMAMPVVAMLIQSVGWKWSFYGFGFLGIVWTIIWFMYATDRPEDHPGISKAELEEISAGESLKGAAAVPQESLSDILKSRAVWGLILGYFCQLYNWYLFLSWLPAYLVMARGFGIIKTGFYGLLPYIGAFIAANFAGYLSDKMSKTYGHTQARKIIIYISFVGSAVFLYFGAHAESPMVAVALITICVSFVGLNFAPFWALPVDISPRNAGLVSGLMNTSGNIAGVLAPLITGYVVSTTGSWIYALMIAIGCSLVGVIIAAALISAKPIQSTAK